MDMVDVGAAALPSSLLDLRLRRTSVSAFTFILRMDGEFNITIRLLSERPPLLNDGDNEPLSPDDMRHRPAPRWLRVADSFCPGIETPFDAHSSGTVRGIGGKGATRDMLTPKMRGLIFSPPKQRTQRLAASPLRMSLIWIPVPRKRTEGHIRKEPRAMSRRGIDHTVF